MKFRLLALAFAAAALLFSGPASRDAEAGASPPAEPTRCTCREGNACYHWLNAPVVAPVDPCSCPNCRRVPKSCPKTYPADWNTACAASARMECFLRRHAASWKLICSEEIGPCDCPGDDSANCPFCGTGGKNPDPSRFNQIRKQVEIERRVLGSAPFVVVKSPHFYLVNDIASLKVLTQNGNKREVAAHELAHLYVQRAELAYQDFCRAFGDEIRTSRPIAIFLSKTKHASERLQTEYFGRGNAGLVYGLRGAGVPPISGNYCEAGVAADLEQQTDDDALHQRVRTSVGHVLMSMWHSTEAKTSHLPMWAFIGAGHWLGRLPAVFQDHAQFIAGEGNAPTDSGAKWMEKLAKAAAKADFPHVDTFLGFTTLSQTDLVTHMRAWSWFQLFVDEDRERFVKLLKLVRDGKNQREAVQAAFGVTPEELDARWRERVTGKRKTMGETKADAASAPAAGAGGLAELARESDPKTVADRIKARTSIDDAADAAALVALLDRDSDLVQERVVLALAKARSAAVREYLRGDALAKSRGRAKVGVVRVLGLAKDDEAADAIAPLLADADPDLRAQAATALGRMQHEPSLPAIERLVADRSDDVALAAMDALASFGEQAEDAWSKVAPRLDDLHRPVRTAAAETLGALGTMETVDALIARMDKEEGRVHEDCRQALKRITRDDLGAETARWKDWWKKEKERSPGKLPSRPAEKPKEDANARYGTAPTYFGIQLFSKRLAFVLDVSSSMSDHIVVDPSWIEQQGRAYRGDATKFEVATAEIAASLKTVDPRLEFGIVTFRSDVRTWRERLVPAGSGLVDQALSYLASQRPAPLDNSGDPAKQKTDLADALRIAFGIKAGANGARPTDEAADEVYVMTDGQPTAGDLVDADVLLSWFREKNRLARLRLHVVTFETIDVDLKFLRGLAEAGGGAFVAIPTTRK
jgi:hypothetical protein